MQLNRSRVFFLAPLLVGTIAACASIEEPDNDTLEVLRAVRLGEDPGAMPSTTMTGTSSAPSTTGTPTMTGTIPTTTEMPSTSATEPPPQGSVTSAPPLPTTSTSTTGSATTTVPSATAVPSETTTAPATSTTPPAATTGMLTTSPATGGTPNLPDDMETGGMPVTPADDAGVPGCGETFGTLGQAVIDATTIEAEYIIYDGQANGQISFHVRLRNTGAKTVGLGSITVRYWYTPEVATSTIKIDSIGKDIMGATVAFKKTPDGTQQYLEISYPADADLTYASADPNVADIQIRLEPGQPAPGEPNVQNDQSNDWSWKKSPTSMWGENPKITMYRATTDGPLALISGSSPCD